jgi:hypothetical protein
MRKRKVVFILEMASEEVALAQVSLIGKAELKQHAFGSLNGLVLAIASLCLFSLARWLYG